MSSPPAISSIARWRTTPGRRITTAHHTEGRIRAIRALMEEWAERIRRERPSVYSRELIEVVFHDPHSKIRFVEEAGIATRQTASKYLQALVEMGLLHSVKSGREVYFLTRRS